MTIQDHTGAIRPSGLHGEALRRKYRDGKPLTFRKRKAQKLKTWQVDDLCDRNVTAV